MESLQQGITEQLQFQIILAKMGELENLGQRLKQGNQHGSSCGHLGRRCSENACGSQMFVPGISYNRLNVISICIVLHSYPLLSQSWHCQNHHQQSHYKKATLSPTTKPLSLTSSVPYLDRQKQGIYPKMLSEASEKEKTFSHSKAR